tara:strand:- start:126 stop:1001 length:876 start_codon:yes stop_codon:yes gene_type:complete
MQLQEVIKKIKCLEIKTRKVVNTTFSGEYQSLFKGQGMNFADLREYQYGDETRLIDWKVTAKTNKPYVKLFEEERELSVVLAVDLSASGQFGSGTKTKRELICELAAVLGFSAAKNKDKVGLLLFTDQVELYIPPKKGRKHIFRILRDIFYFKPISKKTNISTPIEFLLKTLKQKSIIFMLSDFIDQGYEKSMKMMSKKHDFTPIRIEDKYESKFPNVGMVQLEDQETGQKIHLDSNSEKIRETIETIAYSNEIEKNRFFKLNQIDVIKIEVEDDYTKVLMAFFKKKGRKR